MPESQKYTISEWIASFFDYAIRNQSRGYGYTSVYVLGGNSADVWNVWNAVVNENYKRQLFDDIRHPELLNGRLITLNKTSSLRVFYVPQPNPDLKLPEDSFIIDVRRLENRV